VLTSNIRREEIPLKKIIALTATLLLLITSFNAAAYSADNYQHYSNKTTAYRCYDVNDKTLRGLWDSRDAHLINRVGGTCVKRGQDDGDLRDLQAETLSKRDIKRALRRARNRFPDLLENAWLIGAQDVRSSGAKYVKYTLTYQKIHSAQIVEVKVKQNCWSGKVKRMKSKIRHLSH